MHLPTFGYGLQPDCCDAVDRFFDAHPALAPYRVDPAVLLRVYAGDDPASPTMTAALRFETEAEAREVLAAWWVEDVA